MEEFLSLIGDKVSLKDFQGLVTVSDFSVVTMILFNISYIYIERLITQIFMNSL